MSNFETLYRRMAHFACTFCILAAGIPAAQATPFLLTYNGVFNSQNALNLASDPSPAYFATPTPFTIRAWFDNSTPNLAPSSPPAPPPFAGFRAYAPSLVTIDIGGVAYMIDSIATNPASGVSVAIFDRNSFTPGHYGIGIIQDPVNDGAGIVGDFEGASPDFTVDALTSTVFTQYFGVGYASGVCTQGPPDACLQNAVTPLVLRGPGNQVYSLTLGNFDEDYPVIHDVPFPTILGPLNSAELTEVPEPATFALAGLALAGVLFASRRRV